MDLGKDVGRSKKGAVDLANKIAKSDFMHGWLIDNQQNFIEVMDMIKDGAPVKYAELYLKAYQMGIVKESNINININRQKDHDDLQALVRARISPTLADKGTYTPYEEIKPEAIPLKARKEEP